MHLVICIIKRALTQLVGSCGSKDWADLALNRTEETGELIWNVFRTRLTG